jgi:hypothetical protein
MRVIGIVSVARAENVTWDKTIQIVAAQTGRTLSESTLRRWVSEQQTEESCCNG